MASDTKTARGPERPGTAAILEIALALALFVGLLSNGGVRALLATCAFAIADGLRSTVLLVPIDAATLLLALGGLARVAFHLGPLARAFVASPRRRLAWIPLCSAIWIGVFGVSVPAIHSVVTWLVLIAASAVAWLCASRPRLMALAFLPWIASLEPLVGHSPLGENYWTPERLAPRCAENDGVRPADLRPEVEIPRYYAVTKASDAWLLLTGERGSFWVHHEGADGASMKLGSPLMLDPRRALAGNFWEGCVRGGSVWVTSRALGLCEVPIPTDASTIPLPVCHAAPGSPDLGVELDYVDAICPTDRPTVYSSQLVRGGFIELDPSAGVTTFHRVSRGLNLQMVARRDGRILAITTSRFVVFDPTTDRVLEDHPAGAVAMGIDVCKADDAVAITDFTGRVRVFERGADGAYHFSAGAFVPAPRRVSFSPSCDKLVVTSGDDRRAFLLRRRGLEIIRTFKLGPGLRDVVFLDDRWIAAADACTVNLLDTDR